MGWLFMPSLGGHRGPREYLDDQFTHERPGRSSKVLRSALVRMRTYYAAVEVREDGKPREVWACVCLVKYDPRDKDGDIFGYKAMDEGMGPCERECPVAILDLLTPTEREWALEWRKACRDAAAARAARPKLRHGDVVTFAAPIRFADGRTHQTLRVDINPCLNRRIRFRSLDGLGFYRIGGLKTLDYTVAAAATSSSAPAPAGDARLL